jgi:hypothetical protein
MEWCKLYASLQHDKDQETLTPKPPSDEVPS